MTTSFSLQLLLNLGGTVSRGGMPEVLLKLLLVDTLLLALPPPIVDMLLLALMSGQLSMASREDADVQPRERCRHREITAATAEWDW